MITSLLESFAEKTGLPLVQIEEYLIEAQSIAIDEGDANNWPAIIDTVKHFAGITEVFDILPECEFYLDLISDENILEEAMSPAQRLRRSIISRAVGKRTSARRLIKTKRKKSLKDLTRLADKKARNKLKMKLARVKTLKAYKSLSFNRKGQVEKLVSSYSGRVKRIARKELHKLIAKYRDMAKDTAKSEYIYKKLFKIVLNKSGEVKLLIAEPEALIIDKLTSTKAAGELADAIIKEYGADINNTDIRRIRKFLKTIDGGHTTNTD